MADPGASPEAPLTTTSTERAAPAITAAFRVPIFRRAWSSSLASSIGLMIQSVGSAWAMTQLSGSPEKVALVQTALMIPIMIFAMPAGAIADMYDRRIVALIAVSISLTGASGLALSSLTGLLTPELLLSLCFVIGAGMSLMGPAWQSSVSEQVPPEILPSAIALSSISYNLARSFGPAAGGAIVAAAGPSAAFVTSAVLYVPAFIVLLMWKRVRQPARLPPERMGRAIISGVRYIVHSPPTRVVLVRSLATAVAGGAVAALMPLVSRDLLGGDAQTFGILLGAYGVGAVFGAFSLSRLRGRFRNETLLRLSGGGAGLAIVLVASSHLLALTLAALFVAGAFWTVTFSLFNIEIQVSSPRWVAGRSLAAFQATAAGGAGIGAAVWGVVARTHGVHTGLVCSGLAMIACAALGLWLKMPAPADAASSAESELPGEPEVQLGLTPRSGPIVVEMEYRVDPAQARPFYQTMQQIQSIRQRNGAYDWAIARDVADPALWTERFNCPTWLDYLRLRARSTQADRLIEQAAWRMHAGPEPVRVRRMLERPFGSVRWQEEAPDSGGRDPLPLSAFPGGT